MNDLLRMKLHLASIVSIALFIAFPALGQDPLGGLSEDQLTNQIIESAGGGDAGAANTQGDSFNSGGAQGGGADFSALFQDNTGLEGATSTPVDERADHGFVGVSSSNPFDTEVPFIFVGPTAPDSNGAANSGFLGGRGGGGFGGNGFGGGGGAGGGFGSARAIPTNGFDVLRTSSSRARMVPRFRSSSISPDFVAARVTRRLSSLPATRSFSNQLNISMQGRTAVVTGTANSQQQLNRFLRQLRFEPGVSKIDNQASIAQ
ncbi:MAG: BON domain-containing protein [Planctomycetota bacterium]